jgi:hypothetical protein
MTSRGVKVLEHLKNKPELLGTVVPWLRGHAMGQHGAVSMLRLHDEHRRVGVVQGEGDMPTGSGALPIRQAGARGSAIPMRRTLAPNPF